ncbi:MAG: lipopolysaccharide biosynthesis protein [Flavobacteriaceae bacterium]
MSDTDARPAAGAASPRARTIARGIEVVRQILTGGDDRSIAMRTVAFVFLVRVASAGIAYFSQVLIARWIGVAEYGVFVTVWVIILLVAELAPFGLSTAAQRFPPDYTVRGQWDLLRGYLRASRLVGLGVGSLCAVIGAFAIRQMSGVIDAAYVQPLLLACLSLPIVGLMTVQDYIARTYNWPDLAHALPYIVRPLSILAFMGVFVLAGFGHNAETAMYALLAALWISGIIQTIALQRRLARVVPKGAYSYRWIDWFRASLPIFLIDGFYVLLTSTDVLVLSFYVDSEKIGIYFAVTKTLALVSFIDFAVKAAAAHRFAEYNARGDDERLRDFVRDAIHWTFWPSLAAIVGLLVIGKFMLMAFGSTYVEGYPLMYILAVGLLARASLGPVERLLNMLDHQVPCAVAVGSAFFVNLALNLVFIPYWGLTGAAIATTIAHIVEAVLLFATARRYLKIDIFMWSPR